jgi:hypothetical protein
LKPYGRQVESECATHRAAPGLRGLVTGYAAYRYAGARPGVHLGLPSASLTAIVSLDGPVLTVRPPEPAQPAVALHALVSGLHTRAAHVHEPGHGCGIGIGLTPAGARSLLGMPAAELGGWVLPLDELLGRPGRELLERLPGAPGSRVAHVRGHPAHRLARRGRPPVRPRRGRTRRSTLTA